MPDVERYEILILGSGEAGKYLAWTMAKAGHRTAMIERKHLGGSCPSIACLPSKNLIYSAKVASLARRVAVTDEVMPIVRDPAGAYMVVSWVLNDVLARQRQRDHEQSRRKYQS